ncbi:MAG: hypothetical protein WDZ90_01950 [Candidatus Paceibacterota bacterium]
MSLTKVEQDRRRAALALATGNEISVVPQEAPSIRRELLFSGVVVRIKVPRGAYLVHAERIGMTYLRFHRAVRGGGVYLHVHATAEELNGMLGRTVDAELEVWWKVEHEVEHIYIDLKPTSSTDFASFRRVDVLPEEVDDGGCDFHTHLPPPVSGTVRVVPAPIKTASA